jgi:SAM-dependent methyltransferase
MILEECSIDLKNKIIIDAGCGLGQRSILFALLGARKVYGVDLDSERIDYFKDSLSRWRKISVEMQRVELVASDIMTINPEYKANLVVCIEMLSHLWDKREFYKRVKDMLAIRGKMFASDGNNGANPRIVSRRKEKWRNAEKPSGRIYEARKKFIINQLPVLDNHVSLDYLVQGTCYDLPQDITQKCSEFLKTGEMSKYSSFIEDKAPYDPEYCFLPNEDLLYPEVELRNIQEAGLEPEIIPYFMGRATPQLRPFNKILAKFSGLSLSWARGLHIIATKKF